MIVHVEPPMLSISLLIVLGFAGALSAVLLGLGLAVLSRRREGAYILIVLALLALFARTAIAGLTVVDVFGATSHHLFEHGLDVAMAALVIAAVYHARRASGEVTDR